MQTIKLEIVQPLVHHELVVQKGRWIRFTTRGQSVENKFWLIGIFTFWIVRITGPYTKQDNPYIRTEHKQYLPQLFLFNVLYGRS